jgi:hypothetical protein
VYLYTSLSVICTHPSPSLRKLDNLSHHTKRRGGTKLWNRLHVRKSPVGGGRATEFLAAAAGAGVRPRWCAWVASRIAAAPPSAPADNCPRARCAVSEYSANEDESAGGSHPHAGSSRLRAQCDAVRCIAADADPTTVMVLAADASRAREDPRSGAAPTQVLPWGLSSPHTELRRPKVREQGCAGESGRAQRVVVELSLVTTQTLTSTGRPPDNAHQRRQLGRGAKHGAGPQGKWRPRTSHAPHACYCYASGEPNNTVSRAYASQTPVTRLQRHVSPTMTMGALPARFSFTHGGFRRRIWRCV